VPVRVEHSVVLRLDGPCVPSCAHLLVCARLTFCRPPAYCCNGSNAATHQGYAKEYGTAALTFVKGKVNAMLNK
jgi:hypothetical protein